MRTISLLVSIVISIKVSRLNLLMQPPNSFNHMYVFLVLFVPSLIINAPSPPHRFRSLNTFTCVENSFPSIDFKPKRKQIETVFGLRSEKIDEYHVIPSVFARVLAEFFLLSNCLSDAMSNLCTFKLKTKCLQEHNTFACYCHQLNRLHQLVS